MTTWTSLYIIGFIAATFLMEESECSVTNRDSLTGGVKSYLEPGGVYWCSAGSGVVHEQIPTANKKRTSLLVALAHATFSVTILPRWQRTERW